MRFETREAVIDKIREATRKTVTGLRGTASPVKTRTISTRISETPKTRVEATSSFRLVLLTTRPPLKLKQSLRASGNSRS